MSNTYKVCIGSTVAEIEAAVQECYDANYGKDGDLVVTSVIDSSNVITNLYVQPLKLKGA